MSQCTTCGAQINAQDWFCTTCGMEREDCPECGSPIEDGQCVSCSTVRKAPCEECESLIPVTANRCPHCSYSPGGRYENKAETERSFARKGGLFLVGFAIISGLALFFLIGGILGQIVGGLIILVGLSGMGVMYLLGGLFSRVRNVQASGANPTSVDLGRNINLSRGYLNDWKQKKERAHQRTRVQCPNCGWTTETIVYGKIIDIQGESRGDSDSGVINTIGAASDLTSELTADRAIDCKRNWCDHRIYIRTDFNPPSHVKNKLAM